LPIYIKKLLVSISLYGYLQTTLESAMHHFYKTTLHK